MDNVIGPIGDLFTAQLGQRFHLEAAAFLAISFRRLAVMPSARAFPPIRPSATAAAFLPSSVSVSSISPVAIRMTWMALPITSAGRFSPLGPRGINCYLALLGAKHILILST